MRIKSFREMSEFINKIYADRKLSKKAGFESTLNDDNRNLGQREPNYVTSFKCFVENMIRRDHVFGADFESHN